MGIAFGVAMPIFEEYDEASHVLYVRYLQAYRRLPVQDQNGEGARAHHPPGYYLLGALLTSWIPVEGSVDAIVTEPNPNFRILADDTERDNKARWVHYGAAERWPYQGLPRLVHVLRLLSAGFSTVAVWLTYRSARLLRPADEGFALLAAALLAFNPEVVFQAGLAYIDTAALAGGAAIMYVLAHGQQRGLTPWRWALIGVVFSLGLMLKLNVATLAVPIAAAWAWQALQRRQWRAWAASTAALGLPIAALTGWWFVRNYRLYGDLSANASITNLWGQLTPQQKLPMWRHAISLLQDPLGRFGTGEWVSFPEGVYWLASAVIVLALLRAAWSAAAFARAHWRAAGLARAGGDRAVAAWDTTRQAWQRANQKAPVTLWLLHAIAAAAIVVAVLHYAAMVVGWTMSRFLFPAYSSLALILAAGLLSLFEPEPSPRAHRLRAAASPRKLAAAVFGLGNFGLVLFALFGLIIPTYAPPRQPLPGELQRMSALEASIGEVAGIRGYRLNASQVRPGGVLVVSVAWEPRTRTIKPLTVFIHLYEATVGSLAQRDTYPGGGNWSSTVWDLQRVFIDQYRLHVPADAPAVPAAQVLLGLYDRETLARVPVAGLDSRPGDNWIEFGSIKIEP